MSTVNLHTPVDWENLLSHSPAMIKKMKSFESKLGYQLTIMHFSKPKELYQSLFSKYPVNPYNTINPILAALSCIYNRLSTQEQIIIEKNGNTFREVLNDWNQLIKTYRQSQITDNNVVPSTPTLPFHPFIEHCKSHHHAKWTVLQGRESVTLIQL